MIYIPPVNTNELPHLTLAMILDELPSDCVSNVPGESRRIFRWLVECDGSAVPQMVPDVALSQLLFICKPESVRDFLEANSHLFAITQEAAVTEGEDSGDFGEDFYARFGNRVIVLSRDANFNGLIEAIQGLFSRILIWEGSLERTILKGGTLTNLLDISASILGNFMFVSDYNFNVVAWVSSIDSPDDLHRKIIERKCLTQVMIEEKRFRLPEDEFFTRPPSKLTSFDRVSFPVYIEHSYCGSVSMSCNNRPDTQGLRDTFRIMCTSIMPLLQKLWNMQARLNSPSYFFFRRLIQGEKLGASYIESQLDMMGLKTKNRFKLVMLNIDEGENPDLAMRVVKSVSIMNNGNVHCFPYQDHILVLLSSEGAEGKLSHRRSVEELVPLVYEPFGVESAMSTVFFDITDLKLAYEQTKLSFKYRNVIRLERQAEDNPMSEGVLTFEDTLFYCMCDKPYEAAQFLEFTFSCSVIGILHEEGGDSDVKSLAILWHYLQSERNATQVAQLMHMHRNTVLYHIDKIEKRFDFDLSLKSARDWLVLCFKYLFLQSSDEYINTVFGNIS